MADVEEHLLYTKEHEWVSIDDDKTVTIGISDYAQEQLGDITYVELPELGDELEQFEQVASIESVKAANDIFSPMSGEVIEVNKELESEPGLINKSPYEKGWIARVKISDPDEKNNLMTAEEYREFLVSSG
ncbi:MAG TPA: glycine cleavage system protein GcvH [Candidatus Omnitrophota bacterium]|nr:glycine cleavage system protein GcvH [Candidatus Omnitrophota bacterium]